MDVFHFNNGNYLCIVDYHSKFTIIKRLEELSAESLITTIKVKFSKYGIPQKLMSDAVTNFVSDKFQQCCKTINVEQAVSLANHQTGQIVYQICKTYIQKCANSGNDINMALLQIHTTLLGQGLMSPATLMFNRQAHGIMPVLDHRPIRYDCDDEHDSKLLDRQHRNDNDASPVFASLPIGSAVVVQ